ncbi:PREDICTED: C-C motif chemokine 4 homolog [Tinamus guttatus]|uniref:C-C motif chemokine 4 homolog n=1 Tax=Tinamus guttatus TaxID=94827 RepID=UPI00052E9AF2|nr:PREDICTED: C-C motif chemokine 4 homolog [Tinamus guttatus]
MKSFTVALAVLCVAAFCYQASSSPALGHVSGPCCLQYLTREIPHIFVNAYKYTNGHCSQPGVIFTTMKGHLQCVNPEDKWVQHIMKHLKDQAGNGNTTP